MAETREEEEPVAKGLMVIWELPTPSISGVLSVLITNFTGAIMGNGGISKLLVVVGLDLKHWIHHEAVLAVLFQPSVLIY